MKGHSALQEKMCNSQILAALQEGNAGLFDLSPLGRLRGLYRVAHGALRFTLCIALEFQKLHVIFQVIATWRVRGNGAE
jgi:hypothetical protein